MQTNTAGLVWLIISLYMLCSGWLTGLIVDLEYMEDNSMINNFAIMTVGFFFSPVIIGSIWIYRVVVNIAYWLKKCFPFKKKIIKRNDGSPYLIRYTICQFGCFSIKLHKILISDFACLHDHPWAFISIILRGGYIEHTKKKGPTLEAGSYVYKGFAESRLYGAGSVLYRQANHAHRLEIHQPAWTLVVTFKKTRDWGFYTPFGWVGWRQYNQDETC